MSVKLQKYKLKKLNTFQEILGIQRHYQFEYQILNGTPSRVLAKGLQNEGFYKEIKTESLAQKIRVFRRETMLPKIRRILEIESKNNINDSINSLTNYRNAAIEIRNLIEIQIKRVGIALANEAEKGEICKKASKELKLLFKIVVSLGDFQNKAGLTIFPEYGYKKTLKDIDNPLVQKFVKDAERHEQFATATMKALNILNSQTIID
jgi:hypothetical protein